VFVKKIEQKIPDNRKNKFCKKSPREENLQKSVTNARKTGIKRVDFHYFTKTKTLCRIFSSKAVKNALIFGGNIVNTKMQVQFNEAAHNEYIDMLLNIGIIGTGILLMYIAIDIFINIGKAWRKQSEIAMFRVMSKLVWLLYAMTLTVFLDYRFFMFFII
jgi:hypothetical protein